MGRPLPPRNVKKLEQSSFTGDLRRCGAVFLPVKILGKLFRGKFLHALKEAYLTGKLRLAGSTAELTDQQHWRTFLDGLYHKHWVVYAKPPFAGPDHVFRYLGRYTHRIAISNHRLVAFDNGRVSLDWWFHPW